MHFIFFGISIDTDSGPLDAAVVFVTNSSLLFRLARAILCCAIFSKKTKFHYFSAEVSLKINKKVMKNVSCKSRAMLYLIMNGLYGLFSTLIFNSPSFYVHGQICGWNSLIHYSPLIEPSFTQSKWNMGEILPFWA